MLGWRKDVVRESVRPGYVLIVVVNGRVVVSVVVACATMSGTVTVVSTRQGCGS